MNFTHDHGLIGVKPRQCEEIAKAESIGHRLDQVLALCRSNMERAQATMAEQANRHRQEASFEVDDLVWVNGKNLHSDRPSKKLDHKMYGPFKVIAKHGSSCELQLPPGFDAHPTFSVSLLRKDPNDPLLGQRNAEPAPIQVNDDDEWVVDHIIASRKYRRRLEYQVQWVGYEHDPGWYPAEFFEHAQERVHEFHSTHPNQRRPVRLPPAPPPEGDDAPPTPVPGPRFVGVQYPLRRPPPVNHIKAPPPTAEPPETPTEAPERPGMQPKGSLTFARIAGRPRHRFISLMNPLTSR